MVMFLLTDVVFDGSRVPQMRMVFPLSCPMKSLWVVSQRSAGLRDSDVNFTYHLIDEVVIVIGKGRVILVSPDRDLLCEAKH